MKKIVLGVADQVLANDLIGRIEVLEDYEVVYVGESSPDLLPAVLNHEPDVVVLDRDLPPGPVARTGREIAVRRPALPIVLCCRTADPETLSIALETGARGVLSYPFAVGEVQETLRRATEWSDQMSALLQRGGVDEVSRGGVLTFVGSKGGVGTTVVASHLAWHLVRTDPERKVCLVDLDLEKGDVPSYIDLSHRVSIVDLAKIADDLTDRVVQDTVAVHESGLHILPAPTDIRDVDSITPHALRQIVVQLRQMYDVVVVDAGSNVTPAQAAALETSDAVVQVVTSDVPSLRAARRQSTSWDTLGVYSPADVWVLVNKYSRDAEIQQATVDRLVVGRRLDVMLPDMRRGLETAVNTRLPSGVSNGAWWTSLEKIAEEAGVAAAVPAPTGGRRLGRGRGGRADRGQVAIEAVGVLPVTLLFMVLLWQIVMFGLSSVWAGHAANAAARQVSLGNPHSQVVSAARGAVPGIVADEMSVSSAGDHVKVSIKLSVLGPGMASSSLDVGRRVVDEPADR